MADIADIQAAVLAKLSEHWRVLTEPGEREIADQLVAEGVAEKRKQPRRNFPPMYRFLGASRG